MECRTRFSGWCGINENGCGPRRFEERRQSDPQPHLDSISFNTLWRVFGTSANLRALSLVDMAWQALASLHYMDAHMHQAMIFSSREDLWAFAMRDISPNSLAAEFGVWEGYSIGRFAKHFQFVYGFDSFLGLHEDWVGHDLLKGNFDREGVLPPVPDNERLVPRWFDQTIPPFLEEHRENFSFVHMDSDTYEAASTILSLIGDRLQSGTVLVFDEYLGFRGWQHGKYRAWQDLVAKYNLNYKYIAYSERQVASRLL